MYSDIVLCWNPINVVEGEGKWIAFVFALFFISWSIMLLLGNVVRRIEKEAKRSHLSIILRSLYSPLMYLIWFFAVLFSLDRVTENWISEEWKHIFWGVVKSATTLAFGWFLFRYKNAYLSHQAKAKRDEDPERAELLIAISKIASVVIVFVVLVLLHDATGLSLTALLAFGGVGGLAVAFASQEVVQNFFGGFMLHVMRPFFHGESIEVIQPSGGKNIEGNVERIGWYQTFVRSQERELLFVPNSVFIHASVINKTRTKGRLLNFSFFVEMPRLDLFRQFSLLMDEKLRSMKEIDATERISVWIKNMYGKNAEIGLFAIVRSNKTEDQYRLQSELFLEAQNIALALGGTLSPNPNFLKSFS